MPPWACHLIHLIVKLYYNRLSAVVLKSLMCLCIWYLTLIVLFQMSQLEEDNKQHVTLNNMWVSDFLLWPVSACCMYPINAWIYQSALVWTRQMLYQCKILCFHIKHQIVSRGSLVDSYSYGNTIHFVSSIIPCIVWFLFSIRFG